ncbi:hypothetical protein [Brassicibacter mesophilus]|uniref:hypothetical protein n=1 Tax=Brassicibacter mesophilus TaxID=745119 RepID=UPI003D1E74D5
MAHQNVTERKYKAAMIVFFLISIFSILWGLSYDYHSVKREITNTIFSVSFTISLYIIAIKPNILINTIIYNSQNVEEPEIIVYRIAAAFWSIVSIMNLVNLIIVMRT